MLLLLLLLFPVLDNLPQGTDVLQRRLLLEVMKSPIQSTFLSS